MFYCINELADPPYMLAPMLAGGPLWLPELLLMELFVLPAVNWLLAELY
jgi:hypothetical protein